jgi:hypothetical protein
MNVTGTGGTAATSNLTLGVNSATVPGASKDRFLSVNAAGNVTLDSMNALKTITAPGGIATGPNLTYRTDSVGTNFGIAAAGNILTWNLPSASLTNTGAVTTASQTFAGLKTFNNGGVVNNGLNVTGNVAGLASTSNLTLGLTSATLAENPADKVLSVDALGRVTLNNMNITTNNKLKIKTYYKTIDVAPTNIPEGETRLYTFTLTGQLLSTRSAVVVTPLFEFKMGSYINYSRVRDANTVEMMMTYRKPVNEVGGGTQPINTGTNGEYNITIIEF